MDYGDADRSHGVITLPYHVCTLSCILTAICYLLYLRGVRHFRCRPYCYGKRPFGLLAHLAIAISAIAISAIWPPWQLPFRTLVMHGRSPAGIHLNSRLCTIANDHSYTFTLPFTCFTIAIRVLED